MEISELELSKRDKKVHEIVDFIFDKYKKDGHLFVMAIFLNGLLRGVIDRSETAEIANETLARMSLSLLDGVAKMEEIGIFKSNYDIQ
jgi:hypothetical protein